MATVNITDGVYDFPDIKQGNTFKTREIKFTDTEGGIPTNALSEVYLRFRLESETGREEKYLSVGNGITIDDPVNWVISLDSFDVDFPIGKYFYDIDTIDSSDNKESPLKGTMKVKLNI